MTEWTGVLIAAGRGRRLGGTKQLLPWPPEAPTTTLIAAAFDAIAPRCEKMIVVLGHEAQRVAEALGGREFDAVTADPDAPMFESIRLGLRVAGVRANSVLLHPGDHPAVAGDTLEQLRTRHATDRDSAIIPTFRGRGGHPALIPAAMASEIVGADPEGGLAGWWRENAPRVVRLPVSDPGVVRDLDSPEDLRRS